MANNNRDTGRKYAKLKSFKFKGRPPVLSVGIGSSELRARGYGLLGTGLWLLVGCLVGWVPGTSYPDIPAPWRQTQHISFPSYLPRLWAYFACCGCVNCTGKQLPEINYEPATIFLKKVLHALPSPFPTSTTSLLISVYFLLRVALASRHLNVARAAVYAIWNGNEMFRVWTRK